MATPPPVPAERSELSLLRLLLDAGRQFNSALAFDEIVQVVMDRVIAELRAERGALFVLNEDGVLSLASARGIDHREIAGSDFAVSRGLLDQVVSTREGVLTSNAMLDPRFAAFGSVSLHALRSILCVPVLFRGTLTGLLYVDNRIRDGLFDEGSLKLLQAIAEQAAGAIENARFDRMRREVIMVLANAIEARDAYTGGHVERVCGYSLATGRQLGLSSAEMHELEACAILHDVGKIGVPDAVLHKPGKLTPEERVVVEAHATLGGELVAPIGVSGRVKRGVAEHHEKFDGTGYPAGKRGTDIELYARIVAVADTWDAMTTDRPYRAALSAAVAAAELRRCAGTQFDPAVVEAFLTAHGEPTAP